MPQVNAYLDARAEFLRLDELLSRQVAKLKFVIESITEQPNQFHIMGTILPVPMELKLSGKVPCISAQDYPSAEMLETVLSRRREAHKLTIASYNNIPESRRSGVIAPP